MAISAFSIYCFLEFFKGDVSLPLSIEALGRAVGASKRTP